MRSVNRTSAMVALAMMGIGLGPLLGDEPAITRRQSEPDDPAQRNARSIERQDAAEAKRARKAAKRLAQESRNAD